MSILFKIATSPNLDDKVYKHPMLNRPFQFFQTLIMHITLFQWEALEDLLCSFILKYFLLHM